jgi:MFS family permease
MQYGPQAALIAESFPTRLRYSGAGVGYQLASVFAGGPAPLVATYLLHRFDSSLPIALYIMAGAVVTIIATVLLPEPNRRTIAAEFDADAQRRAIEDRAGRFARDPAARQLEDEQAAAPR